MITIDLSGKVALVTGASSGIGRETAILLAKAGAKVAIASRREKLNGETLSAITVAGSEGIALTADVSKEADIKRVVEETVKKFGRLDIAFNNAGIEESLTPLKEKTAELYDQIFNLNVKGVLLLMKYETEQMLKSGGGSIINTSSVAGHIGMGTIPIYVASKHAVEGLTKSVALEFAKQNIRVNSVAPGGIETPMFDRFTGNNADMKNYVSAMHPIGRAGKPKEIADAVLWLASDHSSFVTGQSILVDGGFTAQ